MIKPWQKKSSKYLGDFHVFRVRADEKVSPRTNQSHQMFVLESADWVNVIPITSDGKMVLVEQYRHGSETIELEVPGGVMDKTDKSPVETGCRELREETGYEGQNARIIGKVFPNPAIMMNSCYTVLVENCRCVCDVSFDSGEDLITRLVDPAEVPKLVAEGKIRHSIVIAALYHYELSQRNLT
jgi:ADP-ribose pyrophosphatase